MSQIVRATDDRDWSSDLNPLKKQSSENLEASARIRGTQGILGGIRRASQLPS